MRIAHALVLFLVAFNWPVWASEPTKPEQPKDEDCLRAWEESRPALVKAVESYVSSKDWIRDRIKWDKEITERANDRDISDIALDWFYDNEKRLKSLKGKKTVEGDDRKAVRDACFWFLRFVRDDIPPPLQMRSRMTKENFESLTKWLEENSKDSQGKAT